MLKYKTVTNEDVNRHREETYDGVTKVSWDSAPQMPYEDIVKELLIQCKGYSEEVAENLKTSKNTKSSIEKSFNLNFRIEQLIDTILERLLFMCKPALYDDELAKKFGFLELTNYFVPYNINDLKKIKKYLLNYFINGREQPASDCDFVTDDIWKLKKGYNLGEQFAIMNASREDKIEYFIDILLDFHNRCSNGSSDNSYLSKEIKWEDIKVDLLIANIIVDIVFDYTFCTNIIHDSNFYYFKDFELKYEERLKSRYELAMRNFIKKQKQEKNKIFKYIDDAKENIKENFKS